MESLKQKISDILDVNLHAVDQLGQHNNGYVSVAGKPEAVEEIMTAIRDHMENVIKMTSELTLLVAEVGEVEGFKGL